MLFFTHLIANFMCSEVGFERIIRLNFFSAIADQNFELV